MPYLGELAALATALCWTLSALCWTAAGRRVGSLAVNIIRLLVALPLFMVYCWLMLGEAIPLSASLHAWVWLGLSGVAGFFLCDLFFFQSFLLIGPRLAVLIFSLAPPFSALFSWLLTGERLTMWNWIGMATTLIGILWVVLESPDHGESPEAPRHRLTWRGGVYALLAALAQGLSMPLSKIGIRDVASPFAATEIRLIFALVCFMLLIPVLGRHKHVFRAFRDARAMRIILLGAFVGPFVGVTLLMVSIKLISAGLAQTFVSLSPVMIIPFTAVLYKERISPRAIFGTLVAILGVCLLFR